MEIWGDEERSFLTIKQFVRHYRMFGGFQDDVEEDAYDYSLGNEAAAVRFMLNYFRVHMKEPTIVKKTRQDKFGNVTELHTSFELDKKEK